MRTRLAKPLALSLALMMLLLALLPGAAAEGVSLAVPEDARLLELMFPGAPFEALPNFFYTNEPLDPGYSRPDSYGNRTVYFYTNRSPDRGYSRPDPYGNRTVYQVKETKRMGDQLLVVALILGRAHVEGYMNHAFGVYDLAAQAMAGEVLYFQADLQEYWLGCKDGVASILCVGSTTYQGIETYGGGRYEWRQDHWEQTWPNVPDAQEYWSNRKGVLYHDAQYGPGILEICTRAGHPDT